MTATHPVDREEVMAWLDGELSPARAADVTTHVESCEECRSLAGSLKQLSADLMTWRVGPTPAPLTAPSPNVPAPDAGRVGARAPLSWLAGRTSFGLPRWVFAAAPAFVFLFIAALWPSLGRNSQNRIPMTAYTVDAPAPYPTAVLGRGGPGGSGGGGGRGGAAAAGASGSANPFMGQQPGRGGQVPGRGMGGMTPGGGGGSPSQALRDIAPDGPMIARTASVALVTDHFDDMRPALERLTASLKGSIGDLQITGDTPNQRLIRGSLRVPADRFDDALAGIRKLGRVRSESQSSEDIGDAHRDLVVRIANGKTEERRLNDLLTRTGRLSDVLDVEREVTRVRGDIERMIAQELSMRNRVHSSTIAVEIQESYRAEIALDPMPLSTRLRNALVDGCRDAASSVVETVLVLMRNGPTFFIWAIVLGGPLWWIWRRSRHRISE